MKCICGYEQGGKWNAEMCTYDEINNDGEEFISIDGDFTIVNKSDYYHRTIEVSLFSCPKCNTVQMYKG